MSRFARLALTLVALASIGGGARAQSYDASKLLWVCVQIAGSYVDPPPDKRFANYAEMGISQALGVDPKRIGDPEVKARIVAMFRREMSLPPLQSQLYCDRFPGFAARGTLLDIAANTNDPEYKLKQLMEWGLDINWPDARSGKTMLDKYRDKLEVRALEDESGSWGRIEYERRALLSNSRHYEDFVNLGARHAGQPPAAPPPSCAAWPEDAPEPGVAYTGEFLTAGNGPTPSAIPGVTTISPRQLACLLDVPDTKLLLFAAMRDARGIAGSYNVAFGAASGDFKDKVQAALADTAHVFTFMDDKFDRPIAVYCHHVRCQLSYNVLLRLKAAGYRKLYWMRAGLGAWKAAGYPLGGIRPTSMTRTASTGG